MTVSEIIIEMVVADCAKVDARQALAASYVTARAMQQEEACRDTVQFNVYRAFEPLGDVETFVSLASDWLGASR